MSGDRPLWAHSPAEGTDVWHSLEAHLRGTAELARRFAAPFGGGELAYWLGRLHDCGKAGEPWQSRLAQVAETGQRVGIDHKSLGTRIALDRGLDRFAVGIFGHHGGLIDVKMLKTAVELGLAKDPANVASAESALSRLLPDLPADLRNTVPETWWRDQLVGEMALRLCYSALVDADVLDTQAHHQQLPESRVRPDADFGQLFKRFEQRRAEQLAVRPPSPVDDLRQQVYADCVAAGGRERGIFRLHGPTGSGKTLASAGFALRHAERHAMRRVIVAVPFLTITEQNAAVYRALLDEDSGDPVVLEHHSQVDFGDGSGGRWGRLAAENWDAPYVVTTFVRLFESLYARKPSAMRRLHRLAGSVIVLDEVQALPHDMLVPILDGLRLLVEHFGATVLLSSATQPEFWSLRNFATAPRAELIADPVALTERLRRVTYDWRVGPEVTLAGIADEAVTAVAPAAENGGTALVVVNTTADARAIHQRWCDAGLDRVAYHLSTRMCPAHRRRVLRTVVDRLAAGLPTLLVATQLIEAGVDVDFPVVYRAMAPADSLLQAAGRANREGRLARGLVVVFTAVDAGAPRAYRKLIGVAANLFGPDKADPDDPEALRGYYRQLYQGLNLDDRGHVGQLIQQARTRWQFQTVAEGPLVDHDTKKRNRSLAFQMIRDEGISVVTPQAGETPDERAELVELIGRLRVAPQPDLRDLRRLQPYITTIHRSALQRPDVAAWLRPVRDDRVRVGGLAEWFGRYDPATGISFDPGTEEFVL